MREVLALDRSYGVFVLALGGEVAVGQDPGSSTIASVVRGGVEQ